MPHYTGLDSLGQAVYTYPMSRTYKKVPRTQHRRMKGRRQAIIKGARKGAIPPNVWDDLQFDNQCWLPYNVATRMLKRNMQEELVIKKLKRKFHMHTSEATNIYKTVKRQIERGIR